MPPGACAAPRASVTMASETARRRIIAFPPVVRTRTRQPTKAPPRRQNADGAHRRGRWYVRVVKTDLELRHLRVFAAVVDAGSHTRAARALGLSQSTVSETLNALERALGASVFRKAAKGIALTPSGEVLLAYARRMSVLSAELVAA